MEEWTIQGGLVLRHLGGTQYELDGDVTVIIDLPNNDPGALVSMLRGWAADMYHFGQAGEKLVGEG